MISRLKYIQCSYVKSFAIITIDKAPNNYVVLICKMFYKNHLSDEVGIIGNWNTKTSSKVSTSKNDIANTKRQTKKSTNYVLASKKFQGYQGTVFLVAFEKISIKPLTETISNIFYTLMEKVFIRKVILIQIF